MGALFRRDSASMSHAQRLFALGGLFGTGACLLGALLFTTVGPNDIGRSLTALLILAFAFLLIGLGFVGWGAGYLRSEDLRLGAALTGAPVLTGAYVGLSIAGIEFPSVGGLVVIIPTSTMALVVGYDLWIDNSVSDDR